MNKIKYLFLCLFFVPTSVYAQGAAPEMYGVREIVTDFVRFNDPKASDTCGLSREKIANILTAAFLGTDIPVVSVTDAKPPSIGVARIQLVPEIYSHTDETLDCVSAVSLTAESRANVIVPPVTTLRGVTVVYWKQQIMVSSGQSIHAEKVADALDKMAIQFTQKYRLDQPPEIGK